MQNKNKKTLRNLLDKLIGQICSGNLYRAGHRYFNPELRDGKVTVEDLYSGERVEYVNDGTFTNAWNGQVIL